jgi:alcohol dehydrogenase class IV
MDALSHAVDALHCRLATPASDALALEGARLVARYIRRAATSGGTSKPVAAWPRAA